MPSFFGGLVGAAFEGDAVCTGGDAWGAGVVVAGVAGVGAAAAKERLVRAESMDAWRASGGGDAAEDEDDEDEDVGGDAEGGASGLRCTTVVTLAGLVHSASNASAAPGAEPGAR